MPVHSCRRRGWGWLPGAPQRGMPTPNPRFSPRQSLHGSGVWKTDTYKAGVAIILGTSRACLSTAPPVRFSLSLRGYRGGVAAGAGWLGVRDEMEESGEIHQLSSPRARVGRTPRFRVSRIRETVTPCPRGAYQVLLVRDSVLTRNPVPAWGVPSTNSNTTGPGCSVKRLVNFAV